MSVRCSVCEYVSLAPTLIRLLAPLWRGKPSCAGLPLLAGISILFGERILACFILVMLPKTARSGFSGFSATALHEPVRQACLGRRAWTGGNSRM